MPIVTVTPTLLPEPMSWVETQCLVSIAIASAMNIFLDEHPEMEGVTNEDPMVRRFDEILHEEIRQISRR